MCRIVPNTKFGVFLVLSQVEEAKAQKHLEALKVRHGCNNDKAIEIV